jgi:uncharacterized coiled-coil protein SlyX
MNDELSIEILRTELRAAFDRIEELEKALVKIELFTPQWHEGMDTNVEKIKAIASDALIAAGREHE